MVRDRLNHEILQVFYDSRIRISEYAPLYYPLHLSQFQLLDCCGCACMHTDGPGRRTLRVVNVQEPDLLLAVRIKGSICAVTSVSPRGN